MSSPLHLAVIADDLETVQKLKNSSDRQAKDDLGFTPLELARFLGKPHLEAVFSPLLPLPFQVQFQNELPRTISRAEFKQAFGVIYRPYLTFQSYESLKDVVANCPYLMRLSFFNDISCFNQITRGLAAPI